MFDLLFYNVCAVTMDDARPVIQNAYVAVRGGRIAYVSDQKPGEGALRAVDGKGGILMPGLVNAHAHIAMTLLRGYADDYALQDWLYQKVFPAEARLDARAVLAGVKLGIAEMLAAGVTSASDMYFFIPQEARLAVSCGFRLNVTNCLLVPDPENWTPEADRALTEVREVLAETHGADEGRVRADAAIHAEYTTRPEQWRFMVDLARENRLQMHIHLSETRREQEDCVARHGLTPAALFAKYGVFDVPTLAAHCVFVTDDDIALLAEKGVVAAHNPVSNLKLASGIAPVAEMAARGVTVALGTDGMCSNNAHDMFEEMKFAALLQKGTTHDPKVLPAWEVLKMATVNGAAAQGRAGETGVLREGLFADMILVSTDAPHMFPLYDPVGALVYCARGSDVVMTLVQGRVLYEKGAWTSIDVEAARREIRDYAIPRIAGQIQ